MKDFIELEQRCPICGPRANCGPLALRLWPFFHFIFGLQVEERLKLAIWRLALRWWPFFFNLFRTLMGVCYCFKKTKGSVSLKCLRTSAIEVLFILWYHQFTFTNIQIQSAATCILLLTAEFEALSEESSMNKCSEQFSLFQHSIK